MYFMIKNTYLKKDPQTAKGVHSIKMVPNPQVFHWTDGRVALSDLLSLDCLCCPPKRETGS